MVRILFPSELLFDSEDIKKAYYDSCFLSDIGFEIPDKFVVGYALVSFSTFQW